MQRFFVDIKKGNSFLLNQEQIFQISKVLRYKVGQKIEVVYEQEPYLCFITEITKDNVKLSIVNRIEESREPKVEIKLYQSLIKKEKFEWLIQKATELGVCNVIPVKTKRAIIKLDEKSIEKKLQRWTKIAQEASEQSRRERIPTISKPIKIQEIDNLQGISIVAYEESSLKDLQSFKNIIFNSNTNKFNIFIGPEGGIEKDELELLKSKGFKTVGLGKRILRAETAGISAISAIIYEKDLQ